MKSFLLVLFTLVLALIVFWLTRTGPVTSNDVTIALPREIEVPEPSSVEIVRSPDKTADAGARSRVPDASAALTTVRPPKESVDSNSMEIGSVYGQALVRRGSGTRAAEGKLSLHLEVRQPDNWTSLDQTLRPDGNLDIGPKGEFDIGHLALGTWSVGCYVPGCAPAESRIVLSPEKPRVRVDFELVPQRLVRITLHDVDGRPLIANLFRAGSKVGSFLGAFVSSVQPTIGEPPLANGGALVSRTHVIGGGDADPWCEIEIDRQDSFWVCVAIGDRTLAVHEVQAGEDEVTLVVSKDPVLAALGSVEVTVVDDLTSLALENASVSVRVSGVPTDAHGRVRFDGLMPGELRISAVAKDHVVGSVAAAVSPGTVTRSEIRLESSVTISGSLQSKGGERIQGHVRITPMSGVRSMIQYATVLPDGTFSRSGLAHGEYVLVHSSMRVPPSEGVLVDKNSLQEGMVYVDARTGSVANVVVVAKSLDPNRAVSPR